MNLEASGWEGLTGKWDSKAAGEPAVQMQERAGPFGKTQGRRARPLQMLFSVRGD
jgi:hypothetical protein